MNLSICIIILTCFASAVFAYPNNERIVGGQPTTIDHVPYQVALYRYEERLSECGGTIIHQYAVLTAAHCVVGLYVDDVTFSAGSNFNNKSGSLHRADWIVVHYDYDYTKLANDIAFVKVVEPFVYDENVRAVILPVTAPSAGSSAIIAGWGPLRVDNATLESVSVSVISLTSCQTRYADFELHPTADMICAAPTVNRQGPCDGDAGGGLVVNNVLAGVASWANDCGLPEYPSVYSNVAYFRSFIDENISYIRS